MLKIGVKYTAKNRPQQNHLVEHCFAHLVNKVHAMMSNANLYLEIQHLFCKECFQTATMLDGLWWLSSASQRPGTSILARRSPSLLRALHCLCSQNDDG